MTSYEDFGCNDIQFLIVSQWGDEEDITAYIEEYGGPDVSQVPAIAGDSGGNLITQFLFPISEAYECWVVRPDGSYIGDVPFMWDLEMETLKGVWPTNLNVRPERDWEKLKGRSIVKN